MFKFNPLGTDLAVAGLWLQLCITVQVYSPTPALLSFFIGICAVIIIFKNFFFWILF